MSILILFLACCLILLIFWVGLFSSVIKWKGLQNVDYTTKPVSIVMATFNEARNLQENLPRIVEQDYPKFEVVVTDDHSSDLTFDILDGFQKRSEHLTVLRNVEGQKGKKSALGNSIENASNSVILSTDADCVPASSEWIRSMSLQLRENKEIVLGYGPYRKHPGWINAFIRFETVMTAIQYFSYALNGMPYMGVGRNLMYQKKLFDQIGGFSSHTDIISGDDDLLINQVASAANVAINLAPESFVFSEPEPTWEKYLHQKRRHLSTARRYKPGHQALLSIFAFAQMLFLPLGLFFLIKGHAFAVTSLIFVLLVKWLIFHLISKKLNENDLSSRFLVLDCWFSIYLWWMIPAALWRKPDKWK